MDQFLLSTSIRHIVVYFSLKFGVVYVMNDHSAKNPLKSLQHKPLMIMLRKFFRDHPFIKSGPF